MNEINVILRNTTISEIPEIPERVQEFTKGWIKLGMHPRYHLVELLQHNDLQSQGETAYSSL